MKLVSIRQVSQKFQYVRHSETYQNTKNDIEMVWIGACLIISWLTCDVKSYAIRSDDGWNVAKLLQGPFKIDSMLCLTAYKHNDGRWKKTLSTNEVVNSGKSRFFKQTIFCICNCERAWAWHLNNRQTRTELWNKHETNFEQQQQASFQLGPCLNENRIARCIKVVWALWIKQQSFHIYKTQISFLFRHLYSARFSPFANGRIPLRLSLARLFALFALFALACFVYLFLILFRDVFFCMFMSIFA